MHIEVEYPDLMLAVVRPQGRVDAETAPQLRATLKDVVQTGAVWLVADLSQVTFMDSAGLSALVSGLKAARLKDGLMVLHRPNDQVRTALRLTMLDRVFRIFESLDEAVQSLREMVEQ